MTAAANSVAWSVNGVGRQRRPRQIGRREEDGRQVGDRERRRHDRREPEPARRLLVEVARAIRGRRAGLDDPLGRQEREGQGQPGADERQPRKLEGQRIGDEERAGNREDGAVPRGADHPAGDEEADEEAAEGHAALRGEGDVPGRGARDRPRPQRILDEREVGHREPADGDGAGGSDAVVAARVRHGQADGERSPEERDPRPLVLDRDGEHEPDDADAGGQQPERVVVAAPAEDDAGEHDVREAEDGEQRPGKAGRLGVDEGGAGRDREQRVERRGGPPTTGRGSSAPRRARCRWPPRR